MEADCLQKALRERNIDSMLEDARNDNKDTDAEHLKRKCEYSRPMINVKESDSVQELLPLFYEL